MSINVLVPMDNEKIIAKIESQLDTNDVLTVFNLPSHPVRIIDSLFMKSKSDRIVFVNPYTITIADDFIEMFKKNSSINNMYIRTSNEEITSFVKGSKSDFKFCDSICFHKSKYLRNLKDYSNTLSFEDVMKLFIKTTHLNIYIPDKRIETNKGIERVDVIKEVKKSTKIKKASSKVSKTSKKKEEVNVKEYNSNSWMD